MAADWHVTRQETRPDVTQQGRLVYVKDVHYVIDTDPAQGHEDFVTIPEDRYTADNVSALINDKVMRTKAVAAL